MPSGKTCVIICLLILIKTNIDKVRINEAIKAQEVRVIDESGQSLGIMPLAAALDKARSEGLDLIEISPKAVPPVVKVLSYDKFRYHQEKAIRQQKKKQKKIEVKGIRLSVRIGVHDLEFKAATADKFLEKGNKVKIDMMLRGREKANMDFAREVLEKFLAAVKTAYVREQEPKRLGGIISTIIAPKT